MSDARNVPSSIEDWHMLRRLTPARVALGRTGVAMPTSEVLHFSHAHALARDAVHAELDVTAVMKGLEALGTRPITVTSAAGDRATYLRRPDLGRRLSESGHATLAASAPQQCDLAIVVADGLSATAVHSHALPLLEALLPDVARRDLRLAPAVVATQARVALGDGIGAALRARLCLVLIGERPGLSAPDSLGAYLTFDPRPGRRDNERNCVSNIRAAGLVPRRAADNILWLITEALRRGETGVALKDESRNIELLPPSGPAALP